MVVPLRERLAQLPAAQKRIQSVVIVSAIWIVATVLIWDMELDIAMYLVPKHQGRTGHCPPNRTRLCLAFLSCNRPYYFRESLSSFFSFLEKHEPGLCLHSVWIDQATPNKTEFAAYEFDVRVLYARRAGYALSFQTAFEQCTGFEYFMPLEEDWLIRYDVHEALLSKAIDVLDSSNYSLYGVALRFFEKPGKQFFVNTTAHGVLNMFRVETPWGFSNGPVVYRMRNILEMLKTKTYVQAGDEMVFGRTALRLNFFYAYWVNNPELRTAPKKWPGYFEHIGRLTRAQKVGQPVVLAPVYE